MRPNPAIASLLNNRGKTLLSISGIGFAILLIFMQLGFLGGVADTATVIYNKMDFDVLVRSPDYLHLLEARTIDRVLFHEFESMPEVDSVKPFSISISGWLTPKTKSLNKQDLRGIVLIGVDPYQAVFADPDINAQTQKLTTPRTALIDRRTTRDYGPQNGRQFGDLDIEKQVETELAFRKTRLVGHFEIGTGLAANGSVIVNQETYSEMSGVDPENRVTFGLVKLKPDADLGRFVQNTNRLYQQRFPSGAPIEILTRAQVNLRERIRWLWETPIGMIFMMGVVIAIVVGGTIVYMVLSSDIAKRMNELATLKAMGYTNGYLARSVMLQAIFLAVAAFLPSCVLAIGLYELTYRLSNIPLSMPSMRILIVFVVALGMCTVSGLLALRKIWQAEPASLF